MSYSWTSFHATKMQSCSFNVEVLYGAFHFQLAPWCQWDFYFRIKIKWNTYLLQNMLGFKVAEFCRIEWEKQSRGGRHAGNVHLSKMRDGPGSTAGMLKLRLNKVSWPVFKTFLLTGEIKQFYIVVFSKWIKSGIHKLIFVCLSFMLVNGIKCTIDKLVVIMFLLDKGHFHIFSCPASWVKWFLDLFFCVCVYVPDFFLRN